MHTMFNEISSTYHPIDNYTFTPASETLNDFDAVHKTFNYPLFPTTNEPIPVLPSRKRAVLDQD